MKHFLKLSTTIHITVLLSIIILPSLFSRKYTHKMHPVHTVELIKTQEFLPPTPVKKQKSTPKPKPKTKPKTGSSPSFRAKSQKPIAKLKPAVPPLKTPSLEEKLRAKLEKFKDFEQPTVETNKITFEETPLYTPQFKATISSSSDFPFQWYLDFIQGKISSCWRTPQMVIAKQYSSMVSFTILKDGQVINIRIKRPSGMTNFDKSALQAVEQAQPLPKLPQGYKHTQLAVNVEFILE